MNHAVRTQVFTTVIDGYEVEVRIKCVFDCMALADAVRSELQDMGGEVTERVIPHAQGYKVETGK